MFVIILCFWNLNINTKGVIFLYKFNCFEYGWLYTSYSAREISRFYCFDAFDDEGNSIVICSDDVDFKSFEFV